MITGFFPAPLAGDVGRARTAALFVTLATLWGLSFVATRAGVADVPPVALAAVRFDVAGLVVFVYAVVRTDRWRPRTPAEYRVVAVAGTLFVAAHHALLFAGQQFVSTAVAGAVVAVDPVLAAALAAAAGDRRLDAVGVAGLLSGLAGVGVVAGPAPGALRSADPVGMGLVFGAAAAFALGAVLTDRYRTDLPVATTQAWAMVLGAVLLHATALALGQSVRGADWTPRALLAAAYLAVVAGGAGYLLYFALLRRLGPVEVNLVGYLAPVVAAVGGWALLGESLRATTVLGFALVVAGFALVKRRALRASLRRRRDG